MPFSISPGTVASSGPPIAPHMRMRATSGIERIATQQLDALRDHAEFPRLVRGAATEVMRAWDVPRKTAAGLVMSAVGEPRTLDSLHQSWFSPDGNAVGLAKVIVRRRVLDLLRKDVRRPHHESLPLAADQIDRALGSLADDAQHDPRAQAELNQLVAMVRAALQSFATLGPIQARQAELLQRYALDEVEYPVLAAQLACTQNALRVRIHKAMRALRRYIEAWYPELEDLLGRSTGPQRS